MFDPRLSQFYFGREGILSTHLPTILEVAILNSAEQADRFGGLKRRGPDCLRGREWPEVLWARTMVLSCTQKGWLRHYAKDRASEGFSITQAGRDALQCGKEIYVIV